MKVTPYYLACQHHSKEIVNLLTENANLISAKYGQNAFFFVSKNTQHGAEIVETLDSSDINQKDLDGNTALYYACTEGSVDIAKALILKGADPTLELTEHCPLFLAAIDSKSANSASLIEFLIDYSSEDGKKIDLLYTIRLTQQHYLNSICGHLYPLSVVKKLHQAMLEQYRQKHGDFEKDPFIFHKNATGSYPLRHAVMSSSFEVVEYFLNLTGINSQMDGQNLLIAAANRDASTRADMLQYFIEMKHPYLNPLLIDPGSGKSLLLFVESDFKSVKYLLEKGKELFSTCSSRLIQYVPDDSISEEYAEVDFSATASPEGPYSSSDDDPPTSSVLPSQIVPVVNPLDINFSDNIGRTLLGHLLSSSLTKTFDLELVRYIISQDNFNINHVDKYERTYIDLLALNWLVGGFEVLKLLLEKGLKTNYRFPPLNYIASHGDIKAIELLIQHNVNVNLLSASGSYPIHAAKNLMVVQQLVSHGADITAKTTNGETLLHFAAHRNLPDIVDYLCNYKNFNVNELDNAGKGAIHYAAEYGHVNVLRVLLQKSPSEKVDLVDCDQRTALMIAIENSHKDAILCLIDSNATLTNCLSLISNLESTDFVDFLIQKLAPHHHNDEFYDLNQFLLLHNTAKCGNFSLLSHLLKTYPTRLDRYHIDPKSGNTPLHCAMVGRLGPVNEYAPIRPNLGPIMMPSIKPQHSLAISDNDSSIPDVQYDPIELLKLLTNSSNGAERGHTSTQLSLENAEGLTPLGIALKNGLSIDIVKFLVENGAQIRQSEFLLGVAGSSTEVLKYLILGVKVNAIRTSVDVQTGNTALHIAAWNYCHEFEPLVDLVYHKDTINKPNKDGKTPLHQASHLNKVKYLIQKGANKNEQDGEGRTVLFSPVFAALPQVHEYNTLVNEYGIDPQICDNDGNTILHKITSSSSRYLDPDVIEYFINVFKLDFFQQNNSGQTPYSLALNNSHNSKTIQELLTRYTPPI
jgi:ankyrin repeat protein